MLGKCMEVAGRRDEEVCISKFVCIVGNVGTHIVCDRDGMSCEESAWRWQDGEMRRLV